LKPGQALLWFAAPPGYYAALTRGEAREQLASLEGFSQLLASFPPGRWPTYAAQGEHPVWRVAAPRVAGYVRLLQLLLGEEIKRVEVWNDPLDEASVTGLPDKVPLGAALCGG
jgi:hypothetical protein